MMTFVDLDSSVGLPADTTYDELTWLDVDFEEFGLEDLSATSIYAMAELLRTSTARTKHYEFARMGINWNNSAAVTQGWTSYRDKFGLVCDNSTADNVFDREADFNDSFCLMTDSATEAALSACIKEQEKLYSCDYSQKVEEQLALTFLQ